MVRNAEHARRADRAIDPLSDFFERQTLQVAQHQHLAIVLREPGQPIGQQHRFFVLLHGHAGRFDIGGQCAANCTVDCSTRPRAARSTPRGGHRAVRPACDFDEFGQIVHEDLPEPGEQLGFGRAANLAKILRGVAVGRRRRQRRTDQLRGRLRSPLRRRPDPRLVRQDRASSAQPRRQPSGQPRPVAHRVDRMGSEPRAPAAYVERRIADGRSKAEIMRVLKRYVARVLVPPPPPRVTPTIGAAGLAPIRQHATTAVLRTICRSAAPPFDTARPDKSPPSRSSGRSLVCRHCREMNLQTHRNIVRR